ncbi:MAG TPA: lipopolysaccharide heptosyltransferase family protein [Aquificaceae bacterium]|nr:lipopolysaccharide heptosyltransferase family protein [Aquificaceae bacterium]
MRFLVWQTAFLGDVVLTTPLILTLKENFPDSEVVFVGRPFISELFKGWDVGLLPFSKSLRESFSLVKKIKGFDVAIVPHRSLRTALMMLASRIPERIGFDRSELRHAYTRIIPHRWELHEIERNLQLLKPLGIKRFIKETYLPMEGREREEILGRLGLRRGSYIVINPFSNFPLKEWSLGNWAEVIKGLGSESVVVIGLPRDMEKALKLEEKVSFTNLVGKTNLRELMAVLGGAKLVVSSDSSPVHIANALGVPALTVYTSTSPDYGFYPIKGGFVENPAPCSPCSPNPKKCKTKTKECLSLPSPELVLKSAEELLKV